MPRSPFIQIMIRPSPHSSPNLKPLALPPAALPPQDDGSSVSSLSSLDAAESAAELLASLREQLEAVSDASREIRHQVRSVYRRARLEITDWMNTPLQPQSAARAWMRAAGLPAQPTLAQFLEKLFADAQSLDLTTRRLHFSQETADALWDGKRTVTIFEVIGDLPRLFK